jgi:hypothetical protein
MPTSAKNRHTPRPATHSYPTRATTTNTGLRLRNHSLFSGACIDAIARNEVRLHMDHYANDVVDPSTGKILSYENLLKDPKTRETWSNAMTKELARLAQGLDGITEGTNTVFT